MNSLDKIAKVELHNYFEELKPLILKKTKLLEQEDLTIEEKVTINLEFIKTATLLFIPVVKSFLVNPIKSAIKTGSKELRIFGSIGMVAIVLLVFFIIGWLTLSVLVGLFFYDQGNSLTLSALYSLIFQLLSFVVVSSVGYMVLSKSVIVSFLGFFKRKKSEVEQQINNSKSKKDE